MAADTPRTTGDVLEKQKESLKVPDSWKVVLLNDDYTPMDFVVEILESIFTSPAEAYRIMMQVHTQGSGIAGVYTHEVAETKVDTVRRAGPGRGLSAAGRHGAGVTMFSQALEIVLTIAHREATARRHAHLTLEHLLYALAHDPDGEADPWRVRR